MINPQYTQSTLTRPHIEEEIPSEGSKIIEEARLGRNLTPLQGTSQITNLTSSGTPIITSTGEQFRCVGEPVVISSIPISQIGVPLQTGVPIAANTITTTSGATTYYQREMPRDIGVTQSTVYYPEEKTIQGTPMSNTTPVSYTTPIERQYFEPGVSNIPVASQGESVITQSVIQPRTEIINQPGIEGVSEIPQSEEYMKDSISIGRQSENLTHMSNQQAQLSTMRYESHQNFENWEANRNLFVTDRINVMDDLLAGMEKKLEWLELGAQKVILFFKEREAQEIEYSKTVKHGLTQLGDHFEKGDNPGIVSDFSRGMKESDAFHAQDQKNSAILGNFIKKDILDWILIPSEKEYKIQANSLRSPVYSIRKKLESIGTKRGKLYNKYFKLYDTLLKNPTKPSSKENGIFKRQLKYSLAAREELRMLRLYGEQGLMVISEFTRLATVRMGEIQRCFSLYLQKYTELHKNSATTPEPILELVEKSNGPEEIQRMFSPMSLLSFTNYEFLRKQFGRDEVTYPDLTSFLVNFPESVDPARSSFVSKEWTAVKEGGFLRRDKACSVVATSGNSLLIIEKKHEEQEIGKVKDPYLMRYTKVENIAEGVDGTSLKVVERVPGTLFTHTHTSKLRFETPEEAQSFVNFMNTQSTQIAGEM